MVTFLHCQDRVCQDCVTPYITITIKDKNILKLVCPVCSQPENLDDEVVATEYFNNFDILVIGSSFINVLMKKWSLHTLPHNSNLIVCGIVKHTA